MIRVEEKGCLAPSYQIVDLKIKRPNDSPPEIRVVVDLTREDPDLAAPVLRDYNAALAGIRECDALNKAWEAAVVDGRYNFKTGKIAPQLKTGEEMEPQLKFTEQRHPRRVRPNAGKIPFNKIVSAKGGGIILINGPHRPTIKDKTLSEHEAIRQSAEAGSPELRRPLLERFSDSNHLNGHIPAPVGSFPIIEAYLAQKNK